MIHGELHAKYSRGIGPTIPLTDERVMPGDGPSSTMRADLMVVVDGEVEHAFALEVDGDGKARLYESEVGNPTNMVLAFDSEPEGA